MNEDISNEVEVKEKPKDNGLSSFSLDWKNKPNLEDVKSDISKASAINDVYVSKIEKGLEVLSGEIPKDKLRLLKPNQSKVSPKVALTQAEWMYPKISEPFHSSNDLFMLTATNGAFGPYVRQWERVLNYHFNFNLNKRHLIDQAAKQFYDHGVVFGKVYWESEEVTEETTYLQQIALPEGGFELVPMVEDVTYLTVNRPAIQLCDYNSIIIDPSCRGDLNKAKFIAHKYVTCKADLMKDDRYKNLDLIDFNTTSGVNDLPYLVGDSNESTQGLNSMDSMQFQDDARRLFTVTEYWGMYDIDGGGILSPIVVAYVGDIIIRMDKSPMPDNKLPFVSAAYVIEESSAYGSSNALLAKDEQMIVGNLTRALLDQVTERMTKRTLIHPNMFKSVTEKRKFLANQPAETSGTIDPRIGIYEEQNEKPIDANLPNLISLYRSQAQDNTGVTTIGSSSSNKFTSSNEVNAFVDAASNRESSVLGRFSQFWRDVGEKFIAMSEAFMEDQEVMAITGTEYVLPPEGLPKTIPAYRMQVAVATEGTKRAKVNKLMEVLQFVKDYDDPKIMGAIVHKICTLDDSPDLAQSIYDIINAPPPEPTEQEILMMQLEVELKKQQVAIAQYTAMELLAEAELKRSRAITEEAKQSFTYAKADDINQKISDNNSGTSLYREQAKEQIRTEAEVMRKKILSDIAIQEDATKQANSIILNSTLDPNKRSTI